MKAVILAAGMGKRIRDQHLLPKGFISLGEKTIIEESIAKLQQCGIQQILLVTGYSDLHYQQLLKKYSTVSLIKNENFQNTGSLYSLYCAKDWIDDDFLLLESDLVYEKRALSELIHHQQNNIILLSGYTQSSDEVYVEAIDNHLLNMSKDLNKLNKNQIIGEFVGINKLSLTAYRQLIDMISLENELLNHGDYETQGLVALSKTIPLYCHKVDDLIWCEIDDAAHLQRAKKIYEKVMLAGVS